MNWSIFFVLALTGGAVLAEFDDAPMSFLYDYSHRHRRDVESVSAEPGHGTSILDGAIHLFEEKCKKSGHEDAYGKIVAAKDELYKCVKNLVNINELQEEIDFSVIGGLDLISHKYCRKSSELEHCIENFLSTLDPCLDEKQKERKYLLLNVTDSIINYVCYKGGDRITLFVVEGGTECLGSKKEEVKQCIEDNIKKAAKHDDEAATYVISEQRCRDFRTMQSCIVDALKECPQKVPGYIINDLFSFVYKQTPCNTVLPGPTTEKPVFEEKCRKGGYDESYKKAVVAGGKVQDCVGKIFHKLMLRSNVAKDYFSGDPRRIIGNYCSIYPELKECVTSYTSAIEPCLGDHEKKSLHLIEHVAEALEKFGCD